MLITIISKNNISKLTLSKTNAINYWLYDKDYNRNMLKITNISNKWILQSSSQYQIINPKNIINNGSVLDIYRNGNEFLNDIELKNYNFYYVTEKNSINIYLIYCSPIYENYTHLKINNLNNFSYEITIGKDMSNHIIYNNPLICSMHAKITFLNGRYLIENYDKKFNLYVNDKPVLNSPVPVLNGDRITIYGLSIILVANELFINNPLNQIVCNSKKFSLYNYKDNFLNLEDEEDYEKYVNREYFFKKPRILNPIDQSTISIAAPRVASKGREIPTALALGSSMSMGLITLVNISQTITNITSGQTTLKNAISSLLISSIMLITSILIPIITRHFNKKNKVLDELDIIEDYKKYINKKNKEIDTLLNRNKDRLYHNYPSADECTNIILKDQSRLWERQISDDDFLTIRLGLGNIPSGLTLDCPPIDSAIERTHELYKLQDDCIEKTKILKNAPTTLSLRDKNIAAILCQNGENAYKYTQNLLIQLIALHGYDQLKLVFLLNDNMENQWSFAKLLPHVWDDLKEFRFVADTYENICEVSQYLEKEFIKRQEEEANSSRNISHSPYFLIIIDDYKNVENINIINEILKSKNNLGFSLLFITDSLQKLPSQCQNIIHIEEGRGNVSDIKRAEESQIDFDIDISSIFFFDKICQTLSNILIKSDSEKETQLPTNYSFLEMYNVGNIDQLDILNRWKTSDSTKTLAAPIGIDSNGNLISLDIHEKFHGPHGLIAGSTGSGKSEFIITYILSLAVNYHPDDVTFILIDYKGGGLTDAFKRETVELPHLVGVITNIDKTNLNRSLESIQSELKKRQIEFSRAKNKTNESTMDIYKYQKYYHKGILEKPISHLFIISDEFAELKQQEPEFMDELVSVARIGRSLGVHLILATQRPSGIITDQIRSNTKFGICLKVQSPADSRDVINVSDAASLKNAGQFYLKVGNDDYMTLGQSAYSGAEYSPSNEIKKNIDNAIEFISDTGKVLNYVNDNLSDNNKGEGDQLTNIIQNIYDIAKRENIKETPLWLSPIPETIYLKDLRTKYNVLEDENIINPVIGEYDDPSNQLQNILKLNVYSEGNIIIYGNATSGKETLLTTMLYDIINNFSSKKINFYILDFGSEVTKIFKDSNHVGDIMFASDKEKIARFFIMIQEEFMNRKKILSEFNGDYELYIKKTGKIMPEFLIILNNYESFIDTYGFTFENTLESLLREGTKCKINFLFITGSVSGIKYKTLQNFKQKITLRMNKEDDYRTIFERLGKKTPSNLFGRGLVNLEPQKYFEFQTAKICIEDEWNDKIVQTIQRRNEVNTFKAEPVHVMPEIITVNDVISCVKDLSTVPVGFSNKNVNVYLMNFKKFINIISTNNVSDYKDFIVALIYIFRQIKNIDFYVFDPTNLLSKEEDSEDESEEIVDESSIMNQYIDIFKSSNKKKQLKETVIFIIELDKFISTLKHEKVRNGDDLFYSSLKNAKSLKNYHYIIVDSPSKIDNHSQSTWYKKYLRYDHGIWLGQNFTSQSILCPKNSEYKIVNTCKEDFGYAMIKGVPTLIKLLGMKEPEKKDE